MICWAFFAPLLVCFDMWVDMNFSRPCYLNWPEICASLVYTCLVYELLFLFFFPLFYILLFNYLYWNFTILFVIIMLRPYQYLYVAFSPALKSAPHGGKMKQTYS